MKRFSVVFLLLVLILTGCRSAGTPSDPPETPTYRYTKTPQEAVDAWIAAANAGTYGEAARYYHGAIQYWQNDPAVWKVMVDRAIDHQKIVSHIPDREQVETADAATLTYAVKFSDGSQWWRRFELAKRRDGWIIIGIS